jgi:hypothetical protein
VNEATAAAAAKIQVNIELHQLHCQLTNDATNDTDSDLEDEEDEQESDDEYPEPEAVHTHWRSRCGSALPWHHVNRRHIITI